MNELQTLLQDTVTRLFREMTTQELLESAEEGQWPSEFWKMVEEGGLTRPHLPESAGGAEASWSDAYVIIHGAGYHAVPLPVAETILAGWLLTRAGIEVPEGPLSLLGGPVEEEALSSGKLSWRASRAPWGKIARHGVFSTPRDGKTCIGLVETGEAEIRPGENIAREPRDDLTFLAAPVILGEAAGLPGSATELYGAMIRSAQMAGALQALLDLSVRYAGERIQFGRPIAKFQIIQQELARLAGETAAAGIAAQAAFRAADRIDRDGWDPLFEIASAKVRVGEAAGIGPSIAHQVHGAIGFTYEHRLHFVTRRLWSWRAEYGAERYWAGILGRAAIGRGAEALWPFVTSR